MLHGYFVSASFFFQFRVHFEGAKLSKADLTDSNLSGAVWNGETVFPEGFEIPDELRG